MWIDVQEFHLKRGAMSAVQDFIHLGTTASSCQPTYINDTGAVSGFLPSSHHTNLSILANAFANFTSPTKDKAEAGRI
jgi:hypothetical protein